MSKRWEENLREKLSDVPEGFDDRFWARFNGEFHTHQTGNPRFKSTRLRVSAVGSGIIAFAVFAIMFALPVFYFQSRQESELDPVKVALMQSTDPITDMDLAMALADHEVSWSDLDLMAAHED